VVGLFAVVAAVVVGALKIKYEYKNAKHIQLDDIDTIEEKFDRLDVIVYDDASNKILDGEVVEVLINMFKQKKIGQLSDGKYLKTPLESDSLVTFFADKEAQQAIKEYEYLLNEKQSTLDNYIKYLDTACELAKIDKVQVIEIVKNKNKKNSNESITNLLD
jgi:hypothetical protein